MKHVLIILLIFFILGCCCDPERPVAEINHNTSLLDVKGFDCDCDSDIDYWQHYDGDEPFGSRIYTKGNQGKCK